MKKGYNHQVQMPMFSPDVLLTDFQHSAHKDELAEKYQMFLMAHPKVFEFNTEQYIYEKDNALPYNHCWFRLKDKMIYHFQFIISY